MSKSREVELTSTETLFSPLHETVLLSLGSNIEPRRHLMAATAELACRVEVVGASRVFESAPVGAAGTTSFLNAAVEIRSDMDPLDLKSELLRPLEQQLGRVRSSNRNAPRTIDLDISLYGSLVLHESTSGLRIPDPEILTRAHVAIPLADVAPDVVHPETGQSLKQIAARFEDPHMSVRQGLVLWPLSDRLA